jgi:hypothetical protein
MSGPPLLITAGGMPAVDLPSQPLDASAHAGDVEASTSEWFERTRHYAQQAVANAERAERHKIEKRLDKASHGWTRREITRTYRANAAGDRRFAEEANVLTLHRYVGWLETGLAEGRLSGRVLVGTRLASLARRDRWHRSPKLSVIWLRQTLDAAEAAS